MSSERPPRKPPESPHVQWEPLGDASKRSSQSPASGFPAFAFDPFDGVPLAPQPKKPLVTWEGGVVPPPEPAPIPLVNPKSFEAEPILLTQKRPSDRPPTAPERPVRSMEAFFQAEQPGTVYLNGRPENLVEVPYGRHVVYMVDVCPDSGALISANVEGSSMRELGGGLTRSQDRVAFAYRTVDDRPELQGFALGDGVGSCALSGPFAQLLVEEAVQRVGQLLDPVISREEQHVLIGDVVDRTRDMRQKSGYIERISKRLFEAYIRQGIDREMATAATEDLRKKLHDSPPRIAASTLCVGRWEQGVERDGSRVLQGLILGDCVGAVYDADGRHLGNLPFQKASRTPGQLPMFAEYHDLRELQEVRLLVPKGGWVVISTDGLADPSNESVLDPVVHACFANLGQTDLRTRSVQQVLEVLVPNITGDGEVYPSGNKKNDDIGLVILKNE
ncbi:protein phosphatase 2C domain-containing protein [Patescibacteria group bacterium]|nr:protein phosphatase 2C domain-containing protein [Patescibacteria group bacterium]MDQ5919811.1 hypothetical protein [Patescibacteria group bacterium]